MPGIAAAAGPAGDETVRAADEFVDSVGVNVHFDTDPYKSRFAQFKELIGASRIRYLRSSMRQSTDFDRWRDLYSSFGVRGQILVSPTANTIPQVLSYLDKIGVQTVAAIEGQNEGNTNWFMAHKAVRGDWAGTVVAYQRDVFQALRLRYPASTLPVVSPSLVNWKPRDVVQIRDAAEFSDIVALHPYVQRAQEPETTENYAALAWYIRNFRDGFKPNAPMMATETGYNNVVAPGGGISEQAASIYLPRLLLNNFGAGIMRTFLYEFMDGGVDPANHENHFGMVHFDGTPKPAYHAVSALMNALDDHGPKAARARNQPIHLSFPDAPADLRRQVFLLRDGRVVVALWRPIRIWDTDRCVDIAVAPRQIQVVPAWHVAKADGMTLNSDAAWTRLAVADGRIVVPVSERVLLLRLVAQDV